MTIKNQHIHVYSGDYHDIHFSLFDMDNGAKPLDLTSTTLTWEVVKEQYRIPMFTKTSEEGHIVITDAQGGKVVVKMASEDSKRLKLGESYLHYLRVIDDQGQATTLSVGNVFVE